ncbi:beta-ketoacyl synthase N-terminal-like domain-containing protein [Mycolicibacterium sp. CBM1]
MTHARERTIPLGESESASIAVIGMGCRLPGGLDSPRQLWEALLRGVDVISEVPAARWDVDNWFHPTAGTRMSSGARWGGFIENVGAFDPEFFGMSEIQALAVDPQHRLLLETAWEAVEHAGLLPTALTGSNTGIFVGLSRNDYLFRVRNTAILRDQNGFAGCADSTASARIAAAMGLYGPAFTVDTASASGLSAVHMACQSLRGGESDLALAGGASVMLDPSDLAWSAAQGILSPTGRSRSFDAGADGLVRSEGSAVVVLKRLADAHRDGDRVLAVLRGSAVNHAGRQSAHGIPSEEALRAVCHAALADADVDASTVRVVEADGAGVPGADAVEFRSLAGIYGTEGRCILGSAKGNVGHTDAVAGLVGLMKSVLQVQHGVVPPVLHFCGLSADLADIDTGILVPRSPEPFPGDGQFPRRVAVTCYGLSGTNVHVIVEAAPDVRALDDTPMPRPRLLPLSANGIEELRRTAALMADWWGTLRPDDAALPDLAHTLTRRRSHRAVRAAVVAADSSGLESGLRAIAEADVVLPPRVGQDDTGPVWVFPDEPVEWPGNVLGTWASEPAFVSTLARIEPLVSAEASFSVTDTITAGATGIDRVQPTLFAMQVATAAVMEAHGVRPGAVIGYSTGEVAAAVVAGALSLEDGVTVICRRSAALARLGGGAARAWVELPAAQVLSELRVHGPADVGLSSVTSPLSTVVSGARDSIGELVEAWISRGIAARQLDLAGAAHSVWVDPVLEDLEQSLSGVTPLAATVPFYSATSYDPRDIPFCDCLYWTENLRHTVRFLAAVQAAIEDGYRVFTALSPHPSLSDELIGTAAALGEPVAMVSPFGRDDNKAHGVLECIAELYCAGAAIDFSVDNPQGRLIDAPLPTWKHRNLSVGLPESEVLRGRTVATHPLLGPGVLLPGEPDQHVWTADVGTASHPFLVDHTVAGRAVLPAAVYCEMALAAARSVFGSGAEVRDLTLRQSLALGDETRVAVAATPARVDTLDLSVRAFGAAESLCAAAVLQPAGHPDVPRAYDVAALLAEHPHRVEDDAHCRPTEDRGIQLGPAFSGLLALHSGNGDGTGPARTWLAELEIPASVHWQQVGYEIPPVVLEAALRAVAAALAPRRLGGFIRPVSIAGLRVFSGTRAVRYGYARTVDDGDGSVVDLDLLDARGNVVLAVTGARFGPSSPGECAEDRLLDENLMSIGWVRRQLPGGDPVDAGSWLLLDMGADDDLMVTALTDALKLLGAECATLTWPPRCDEAGAAEQLRVHIDQQTVTGLVVVAGRGGHDPSLGTGFAQVCHLLRVVREVSATASEHPRLHLLTRGAQTVVRGDVADLEQAGLRGVMRVVDSEYPHMRARQIDLDEDTDLELIARQLVIGTDDEETAWRDGTCYAARLRPAPIRPDERRTVEIEHGRDAVRLQIRRQAGVESLETVAVQRVSPGPGQIEVALAASVINDFDLLVIGGGHSGSAGNAPGLGTDFVGVVTAVGPGVTDHRVGDRVGGITSEGCWATFIRCAADAAVRLPAGLADLDAAAAMTPVATAWHALHELARVSSGDKVLIQSAGAAVGRAAVAIARAAGAQVYATAESEPQRQALRGCGLAHVYDAADPDLLDQIRSTTAGYGFDIVLNSLTGPARRAAIDVLAMGGRFVEIGIDNIYSERTTVLTDLRRNLAFYALDLAQLAVSHPATVAHLVATVYRLCADRSLLAPEVVRYPLADAGAAIEAFRRCSSTGRVVLEIPRTGYGCAIVPPEEVPAFGVDGSYIVTGGTDGVGLVLAQRIAELGCGRIVLGDHPAGVVDTSEAVERIRRHGIEVVVVGGDLADESTAQRLVAAATAGGRPLRGVLHAVTAFDGTPLVDINEVQVESHWAAKAYAAWRLHEAVAQESVEWFCVILSTAALTGAAGQVAPVAADSWLEAFAQWRWAQGLPATAIAVGDSANHELVHAFQALLRHDRVSSAYEPLVGQPPTSTLTQRQLFAELITENTRAVTRLRTELDALPYQQWPALVRPLVLEQVCLQLRRSIDPARMLPEYGLDSLGNLELRGRIESETGVRVTSTDITTVDALVEIVCDRLRS